MKGRNEMETQLTKNIKKALHYYKPKMNSQMRTIRYADEVWTPNGIVDTIRFEDYVADVEDFCELLSPELSASARLTKPGRMGKCKIEGLSFPNKNCKGCFYHKKNIHRVGMMITAYEVKISKKDFLSKNGHNIDHTTSPIGNENYYCVPKEIVKDIEELVPEHVGILTYHGHGYIRKYRECQWMEVSDETKVLLLYNALKKWVDGKQQELSL